ncbi:MAG TPA: DinB family protein [Ignavibacteriaceae bacterium]|nr:DinB family protein [Ignavibacteriaceae bacterium]
MNIIFKRPEKSEYSEYYEYYIKLVEDGDILATLQNQIKEYEVFLSSIPKNKENYAYAEDKWSVKEVIGHINDAERVYGYRALRFIRNDKTLLSGYEQDDYVINARFGERTIEDMKDEFIHLRMANIIMFKNVDEEESLREGFTNEKLKVTVRSYPYIIAGHLKHHIQVIKEKYL